MTTKIKILAIAACCFIAALCSTAQSSSMMPEDFGSTTTRQGMNTMQTDTLDVKPILSQASEDASWGSYLLSPVKATLNFAKDFATLAYENPKMALALGVVTTTNAAVAAQSHMYQCFCGNYHPRVCGTTKCDDTPGRLYMWNRPYNECDSFAKISCDQSCHQYSIPIGHGNVSHCVYKAN